MLRATRENFPITILVEINFWQLESKEFTKSYDIYEHTISKFQDLDLPF